VNDSMDPADMFGSSTTTRFACRDGFVWDSRSTIPCPTAALCASTLCGVQYSAASGCDGFMTDISIRTAVAAWLADAAAADGPRSGSRGVRCAFECRGASAVELHRSQGVS